MSAVPGTLVLLRHGESEWNAKNLFTGWVDVDLSARGEDEVHGSLAPWLAWSADFAAGPGISGPATIVIAAPDAAAAAEPWFVRVRDYPGVGSALAWDRPAILGAGSELRRRFEVVIADGRLTEAETRELAAEMAASRL